MSKYIVRWSSGGHYRLEVEAATEGDAVAYVAQNPAQAESEADFIDGYLDDLEAELEEEENND